MLIEDSQVNYITGWIKIYRSLKKHWLWPKGKPLTRLEAWLLILIETNHDDEKILIKGDILHCKRGEKLYSIGTWAKMFNWSEQMVRTFFKLLENDEMIITKGDGNTTRLIVCNYDNYQDVQRASNEQATSKQRASNEQATTIKELKNDKNDKEDKNSCSESKNSEPVIEVNFPLKPPLEEKKKKVAPKKKKQLLSLVEKIPTAKLKTEMDYATNLVKYLYDNLKKKYPERSSLQSANTEWIEEMERLIRIDGKTPEDIKNVLIFYFKNEDEFWSSQIKSAGFLRKYKAVGDPTNFELMFANMNRKLKEKSTKDPVYKKEKVYLNQ